MVRLSAALAAAIGCATASFGAAQQVQVLGAERAFEQFKQEFSKVYDAFEHPARFAAFVENYAHIMAENAKGHSYELGINEFADMTPDEFAMTRLGLRPREKGPWGDLPNLGIHESSNGNVPNSVDWVSKGAVGPVKNQGQCGACWAFSSTGAIEGAWEIATGELVSLSEQQLVDCSTKQGNQGCSGGLMDGAFQYEELAAVCTEDSYPYKAKNGICHASGCTAAIPKGAVVGFKDVSANNEQALMAAVAQQPVSVAIEADKSLFQLYKSGVLTGDCGTQLDHGVLAVGYGQESNGQAYWLVKNSWGQTWGMKGYVKLARGVAGAGMCGINSQPSYPIVQGSGPSPSPPPGPPPAPLAPPAPATSHYEKPPCQADEVEASVEGVDGELCAPACDRSGSCPTDTPGGTRAEPRCLLQDASSGKRYCALSCRRSAACPDGAKCARQGTLGICVYPPDTFSAQTPRQLSLARSAEDAAEKLFSI